MRKKAKKTIEIPVAGLNVAVEKRLEIPLAGLSIAVLREFSFPVSKLSIVVEWKSLKGLNAPHGQKKTKNAKFYAWCKKEAKKKRREKLKEYMEKVMFD